jgi:hypothetical protein
MEYRVLLGSSGFFGELGNLRDEIGKLLGEATAIIRAVEALELSGPLKISRS